MRNQRARQLREFSTDTERRMWSARRDLRLSRYKFRREHGRYIVDFACIEYRLFMELDGDQHADSAADARRTAWLESQGWRMVWFWNNDILGNASGVIETILRALEDK